MIDKCKLKVSLFFTFTILVLSGCIATTPVPTETTAVLYSARILWPESKMERFRTEFRVGPVNNFGPKVHVPGDLLQLCSASSTSSQSINVFSVLSEGIALANYECVFYDTKEMRPGRCYKVSLIPDELLGKEVLVPEAAEVDCEVNHSKLYTESRS